MTDQLDWTPPEEQPSRDWTTAVSLPRLLDVRHQLSYEVCMQLSHGSEEQIEKLVADLLRVEEQVLVISPRTYARNQSAWGRLEAELLHVPGDPRATWCIYCAPVVASAQPGDGTW
ncbi:MAG: hypothetical protein U0S36_04565 [Candidatus Nanopelagicales bacterium]